MVGALLLLGGLVPIANDALAVRRNDRVRAGLERGLRDGLFASLQHGRIVTERHYARNVRLFSLSLRIEEAEDERTALVTDFGR